MSRLAHAFAELLHRIFLYKIIESQISKTKLLAKSKRFFSQLRGWCTRRHARANLKYQEVLYLLMSGLAHTIAMFVHRVFFTRIMEVHFEQQGCFQGQGAPLCSYNTHVDTHTRTQNLKILEIFFSFLFEGRFSPSTCESEHLWLCNA